MGIEAIAKDIASFERSMDDMKSAIGEVGKMASSTTSPMDQLSTAFDVVAIGALSAAAAVGSALVGALTASIVEAAEAQKIWTQLEAVIASTGGVAGVTSKYAQELAMQFRDLAGGSDEAVASIIEMGLRMGNITAEQMPKYIQTVLDLAAATGTDYVSAARLLAQAQEDPTSALLRFRRMGIMLDKETEERIKLLVTQGKVEEANALLLEKVGIATQGRAAAMSKTFSGQLAILKNHIMEVFETIGGRLLPVLQPLIDKFIELADNAGVKLVDMFDKYLLPVLQNVFAIFLKFLGGDWKGALSDIVGEGTVDKIIELKDAAVDFVNKFVTPFIEEHGPTLSKAIIAVGVAFAGWKLVTTIGTLASLISTITPLGAAIAIIGAAIGLFTVAWDNNWFGIRTTLIEVWETTLKPALEELGLWIQEYLPVAIQVLAGYWNNVLYPALEPIISQFGSAAGNANTLADIYNNVIAPAIQFLADVWTNVLYPALAFVMDWITNIIIPYWSAFANLLTAVVGKALEAFAGLWQNVLAPAISQVMEILRPFFEWLQPILQEIVDNQMAKWVAGFESLKIVVKWVSDEVNKLADAIRNLELPPWLTPGSPTPFEMGLRGIDKALNKVDRDWPSTAFNATSTVNAPPVVGPGGTTRNQTTINEKNVLAGASITNNTGFDLDAFSEAVRNA